MAYELKEYLKSINESKEDLMNTNDEAWAKKYPAYIVNRCLSMFWDTLPQANEMNGYHFLDNKVQFQFLINTLRQRKRFSRWEKSEKFKDLDVVKEYYGCSSKRAEEYLSLLDDDSILKLNETMDKGGINHGRTTE